MLLSGLTEVRTARLSNRLDPALEIRPLAFLFCAVEQDHCRSDGAEDAAILIMFASVVERSSCPAAKGIAAPAGGSNAGWIANASALKSEVTKEAQHILKSGALAHEPHCKGEI